MVHSDLTFPDNIKLLKDYTRERGNGQKAFITIETELEEEDFKAGYYLSMRFIGDYFRAYPDNDIKTGKQNFDYIACSCHDNGLDNRNDCEDSCYLKLGAT